MSVDNSTENILFGSTIPQVSQSLTRICSLTYIHYVLSHMPEPSGEFISVDEPEWNQTESTRFTKKRHWGHNTEKEAQDQESWFCHSLRVGPYFLNSKTYTVRNATYLPRALVWEPVSWVLISTLPLHKPPSQSGVKTVSQSSIMENCSAQTQFHVWEIPSLNNMTLGLCQFSTNQSL